MAINLKNTRTQACEFANIIIYGEAGVGKTRQSIHLRDVVILSCEDGLLSVKDYDLPFIEIKSSAMAIEALDWAKNEGCKTFKTLFLDSASELAEVVLREEKVKTADGRQAYMKMQERMYDIIQRLKHLPMDVVCTAKLDRTQDETGKLLYSPLFPGQQLAKNIPHDFDAVLCLRPLKAGEKTFAAITTNNDGVYQGKDRSGKLDPVEEPNIQKILNKIKGIND